MNNFNDSLPGTPARDRSERHMEGVRLQGGMFVEAVRVTRMPMMVTDAISAIEPLHPQGTRVVFMNADDAAVVTRVCGARLLTGPVTRNAWRQQRVN